MPRKKPFSNKQRKVQLQEKRAVKRGEVSPPPTTQKSRSELRPSQRPQRSQLINPTSQKLQSRFVALTPEYLETTKNLSHSTPLPRPIPKENAVFPVEWLERDQGALTCPSRPKFKFGQTKKEVEKNEEGWFKKWLKVTQGVVEDWVGGQDEENEWPRSTSWFETNLEVWRQL